MIPPLYQDDSTNQYHVAPNHPKANAAVDNDDCSTDEEIECSINLLGHHNGYNKTVESNPAPASTDDNDISKGIISYIGWDSVNITSPLGCGKFGKVFLAEISSDINNSNRGKICLQQQEEYAVKVLNCPRDDEDEYEIAKADMTEESRILWKLSHNNIIDIYASSKAFLDSSDDENRSTTTSATTPERFFVVLEALTETLDKRLRRWRLEEEKLKFRPDGRNTTKKNERLFDRLQSSATGIADGLAYLHSHNIAHLDIKADNIGYDENGVAKIFDFGMAQQMPSSPSNENENDEEPIDGHIGTPRYMAPEIMRLESLGVSADIYSFAIVLWEICTLERPYSKIKTVEKLYRQVGNKHARPNLRTTALSASKTGLRELLSAGWDPNPKARPSAEIIQARLKDIFSNYENSKLPLKPLQGRGPMLRRRSLGERMPSFTRLRRNSLTGVATSTATGEKEKHGMQQEMRQKARRRGSMPGWMERGNNSSSSKVMMVEEEAPAVRKAMRRNSCF